MEARKLAAAQVVKQREDGIRAQAIGEGRKLERTEILHSIGKQHLSELSQVYKLEQERDARPTRTEYARHGIARLFQGALIGGLLVGATMVTFNLYAFDRMADTIARTTRQDVMTGAIVQAAQGREEPRR